jgi:hypothetical protein
VCGLRCLADHAVYIRRHFAKKRHVQEANALKALRSKGSQNSIYALNITRTDSVVLLVGIDSVV